MRFGPADASVEIRTYKDGLLSRLGHDLLLRVGRFEIEVEEGVEAWFEAASIDVVMALRDGRPDPTALSASDKDQIRRNIAESVLHTRRFSRIAFRCDAVEPDGDEVTAEGRLTVRGREAPVRVVGQRQGDALVANARLDQRAFGIEPFTALLGALRIKPEVDVAVTLRGWR
jgi:polyisoprenoid-binding protein YceI